MFEAGFTYILSKSLMNTRTNKEKSEPNFPGRKRVRIFLYWCTANTNELQKTFVFCSSLNLKLICNPCVR